MRGLPMSFQSCCVEVKIASWKIVLITRGNRNESNHSIYDSKFFLLCCTLFLVSSRSRCRYNRIRRSSSVAACFRSHGSWSRAGRSWSSAAQVCSKESFLPTAHEHSTTFPSSFNFRVTRWWSEPLVFIGRSSLWWKNDLHLENMSLCLMKNFEEKLFFMI